MFKKLGKSANFIVNINYVFLKACLLFGKKKKKEKQIGKEGQRGKRKEKDKRKEK